MKDTMKSMYISCAAGLNMGDFTRVKTGPERTALINKIADMYCDATDKDNETVRSQTISALMLLFYGEINKIADKCKAVVDYDFEDFASKLYECINVACQYRAWKDGKHTAEACIRSTIASRGAAAILYESNLDKNKANVNTYSLDVSVDGEDDAATTKVDTIEDSSANKYKGDLAARLTIQKVLDTGDLISGIILDNIAFNDCQKETKETKVGIDTETGESYKYIVNNSEFSEYVLVRTLNELDSDYLDYFLDKYSVNKEAITAAYNRIKSVDNGKLYKFVRDTLAKQRAAYQA